MLSRLLPLLLFYFCFGRDDCVLAVLLDQTSGEEQSRGAVTHLSWLVSSFLHCYCKAQGTPRIAFGLLLSREQTELLLTVLSMMHPVLSLASYLCAEAELLRVSEFPQTTLEVWSEHLLGTVSCSVMFLALAPVL